MTLWLNWNDIISQNQGLGLSAWLCIGLCRRRGTGLIDLTIVVQIQKDSENEDKKYDSNLCMMLRDSLRKEHWSCCFLTLGCHHWNFLFTSYIANWSLVPQSIRQVFTVESMNSSRMRAYLVSYLDEKKLALSGSKHIRPLLSHLGTEPKQEIHFLSSGLLCKISVLTQFYKFFQMSESQETKFLISVLIFYFELYDLNVIVEE